ncbi:MAG TPA: RIP metalloprotease RseP [Vicinamibacterales bacterium]|nr:RIP metalloprotease RseP [Vicinamibacterales bacterium]
MTTIWAFLLVLGVLVFVHELGHFLMARRIGVRVLTFSLGFGPKLLKFRRGDTEYAVSAIPLGGYVKMAGENPDESLTGRPDEFLSRSKWERFLVYIMGPAMNLVLAVVVMAFVLYQGADVPAFESEPVVIGKVLPKSPAEAAGLRPGDQIVEIDDREVPDWEAYSLAILPKAGREVEIIAVRDGRRHRFHVTPIGQTKYEVGDIGVQPRVLPQIMSVRPGEPAANAGLRKGDVILAADGRKELQNDELIRHIRSRDGKPIIFTIRRDGQVRDVSVTPVNRRIGADLSPFELRTIEPSFFQAIGLSFQRNWEWTRLIFTTLAGLFTRETSVRQLMGPVGIAELSGGAAEMGWIPLLNLMAMISLNLGLLNLMPIPVLDGGHIAIMALEGVARRDFSVRAKERLLLAGFMVLMALMVTVIYNDLTRVQWIERLMPWR